MAARARSAGTPTGAAADDPRPARAGGRPPGMSGGRAPRCTGNNQDSKSLFGLLKPLNRGQACSLSVRVVASTSGHASCSPPRGVPWSAEARSRRGSAAAISRGPAPGTAARRRVTRSRGPTATASTCSARHTAAARSAVPHVPRPFAVSVQLVRRAPRYDPRSAGSRAGRADEWSDPFPARLRPLGAENTKGRASLENPAPWPSLHLAAQRRSFDAITSPRRAFEPSACLRRYSR